MHHCGIRSAKSGHKTISSDVERYHAQRLVTDFNNGAQNHPDHRIDNVTRINQLENRLHGLPIFCLAVFMMHNKKVALHGLSTALVAATSSVLTISIRQLELIILRLTRLRSK